MIHPSMLVAMPGGVYPSLCTIQIGGGTPDAYGHVEPVTWSDLAGYADIPCRIAPRSASEHRRAEQVYAEATHTVGLQGYYPAIRAAMRAVADGIVYDIEGVEHDGNRATTRLYARLLE